MPIEKAYFVPPAPPFVMDALSNWENYLHENEKDTLVQLAVLKAQFELIHPFRDGNGRIGRMLVPLILYYKKMLSSPIFYISAYFERNREIYYDRLRAISREDDWNGWNNWISFFLQATIEQAEENSHKATSILDLYKQMKIDIPTITHSQYSIQAIDALFTQPIFYSPNFAKNMGINRMAAQRILRELAKHNIIEVMREGKGRRPTIYAFTKLLQITES